MCYLDFTYLTSTVPPAPPRPPTLKAWRSKGMEGGSWTEDAATSRAVRLCMSLAGALAGLHRKTSKRGWERVTAAGVGVFLDWLTCRPQFGEGARGGARQEEFQHVMACVVEFANGVIRRGGGDGGDAFSTAKMRERERGGGQAEEVDPDDPLWEDEVRFGGGGLGDGGKCSHWHACP